MKFKKILRTLAVTALMFVGGSAINASAATKTDPSDTVNIQLHKMDNRKGQEIQNTGDEINKFAEGITNYDPSKYGDATYSIYNIDTIMEAKGYEDGKITDTEYKDMVSEITNEIVNGKSGVTDVIDAQEAFITANNLTALDSKTITGTSNTASFSSISNKGTYLILETAADANKVSQISAPIIITLPIRNSNADIHLYPKNVTPVDTEITLKKVGQNPTSLDNFIDLSGVKFELKKGNTVVNSNIVSGTNGQITLSDLQPGVEYTLTETEMPASLSEYISENLSEISLKFTVDQSGNITITQNDKYFVLDSENNTVTIKNYLKLGGANFIKVDKADNSKVLAGAKFKISKTTAAGVTTWAQFDENHKFTGWVANKDDSTDDDGNPIKGGTELISGTDGKFGFTGVPYAYDAKNGKVTYHLVETQAPSGYAKLADPFEFNITATSESETATAPTKVENERYSLPITGGMGIWLFVIAGLALMGGSGYLYYKKQRNA